MPMMTAVLVAIMLLAGGSIGPQQRQQDIDLQAAIRTESVDGDLQGAIKQYRAIVERYAQDRALVATALVRMAECHQKLGDAEARKIYDRLIRDFADQKEAVTLARARMGLTASATAVRGDRAVWTGPMVDVFGRVSPDGRYITFVDWETTGNVMVHDLVTNTDRALTPNKNYDVGEGGYSAISLDGKRVAYAWHDNKRAADTVQVAALDGSGQPRELISFSDKETRFISPFDWSPDGKWIALLLSRTDGTSQISILSAADGSLRVLKTAAWSGPWRMFFSMDSRYLAYDLPQGEDRDRRDIFLLAIDGSRETAVVTHSANDYPMGWSPDGSMLLFSSDRTGSAALWGVPIAAGRPTGAPEVLKGDIGDALSLGVTAAGALYVYRSTSSRDIRTAAIDLQAGTIGEPVSFDGGYLPKPRLPDWSPDGKHLAYQACDGACIAVRNVATQEVRQVPGKLLYAVAPRWSPDGRTFVTAARDRQGRNGIFLVNAQSGDATTVVLGPGFTAQPQWSPDGSKIYYQYPRGTILERELENGRERVIYKHGEDTFAFALSPHGRLIAVRAGTDASATIYVLPIDGGQPRELLHVEQAGDWIGPERWTPDSSALLVTRNMRSRPELLMVPVSGEGARKLDIDITEWMRGIGPVDQGFGLSRDGRQIAPLLTGKSTSEVWALENFLPSRTVTK